MIQSPQRPNSRALTNANGKLPSQQATPPLTSPGARSRVTSPSLRNIAPNGDPSSIMLWGEDEG